MKTMLLALACTPVRSTPVALAAGYLAGPKLEHWPESAAEALENMIAANAHKNGSYAVFDMDNTSYQYDIEESLLPFLENKGVLSRDSMDPSLKLIPFKDIINSTIDYSESLYSYYQRLCEIDDTICYAFCAQIFSSIPLRKLKEYVDELMALNGTIPTTYYDTNGTLLNTSINPPKIFRGQVELWNKLMANGIEVYVMSASSEELVRMVVSDPKYGYNLKPENVIGVTLLMKNPTSGEVTSSRKQIADGTYNQTANLDLIMTPYLWAPGTWQQGKWAAILKYISEWKQPILVGGDTPKSDGPMLFHGVNVAAGGVHLWINRKESYMKQLNGMMKQYSEDQNREGLPVTADKNWVIVRPQDIL